MKILVALAATVALALAPQALAATGSGIVTEHSPSQNRVDRANAAPAGYQIVTEHSPSQNAVDRTNAALAGYQIVTEHSPSQNRIDRLNATPLVGSSGSTFQWSDAGIGASAALGAVLVLSGGALVLLRRRGRLAF